MTTRIADLPDIPDSSQNGGYVQMNMHPNPYGNQPPQNNMMPPPEYIQAPPKLNGHNLMLPDPIKAAEMQANIPQAQLPSRDIPIDMASHIYDEQVTPNYIPPVKPHKKDYIASSEDEEEIQRDTKRKRERRVRFADDMYVSLQRPIIVALLFFLFSTPFFNSVLARYGTILFLFNGEGNITTWGITFKSVLFGALVYGLDIAISTVMEI